MKQKSIMILTLIFTFLVFPGLLITEQVSLEEGAITFDVPSGFTQLTAEEIRIKFPSVNAPKFVVGNENRTITIAYDIKDTGVARKKHVDSELSKARKEMAKVFDRIVPGIKWVNNEITEINGKKWILFELTSNAIDQDIHNIMLMTFFRGRMFIVNFNSTKPAFQEIEDEFKLCIQTLKVKE